VAVADLALRYALATLGLLAVIAVTHRVWRAWRTRDGATTTGKLPPTEREPADVRHIARVGT
jgi:hypothetical protein